MVQRVLILADGPSPALVQKQLRHSDPRITLAIYAHVSRRPTTHGGPESLGETGGFGFTC
jgi:hypothetical protein